MQTSRKTHVYALKQGAFPNKKDKKAGPDKPDDGKPWSVRGMGMVFRVHSRLAISQATMGTATAVPDHPGGPIGSRPMRLPEDEPIDSQLHVVCVNRDDKTQTPIPGFTLAPVMKDVPCAIWGSCKLIFLSLPLAMMDCYLSNFFPLFSFFVLKFFLKDSTKANPTTINLDSSTTDPNDPSADTDAILNPKTTPQTISLMMGVEVTAPPPIKANDTLKRFNVHDAFNHDCFEDDDQVIPPIATPEIQTLFLPVPSNQGSTTDDQRALEVRQAWQQPTPQVDPSQLASTWATKMGWATDVHLVGPPPQRVLAAFDEVYPDLPFLVAVR